MLIPLLLPSAFGSDFDEVQSVAEPADPTRDLAGRARVAVASPAFGNGDEWVVVDLPGGGILELESYGFSYTPHLVTDKRSARARAGSLLVESQERFVEGIVAAVADGRLEQFQMSAGFSGFLGAACPDTVCGMDRVGPRQLEGFPLVPDDEPRRYGDVAVTERGDLALFALDEDHMLVVGDDVKPRIVMHHWIASEIAVFPWYSLIGAPRTLGRDLPPAQIETLVTNLPMGLPDTLQLEAPRSRYRSPRAAAAVLALDARVMGDPAGLAPGAGAELLLGIPFTLDTATPVVLTPFVGGGLSHRAFAYAPDDRYAGLAPEPAVAVFGLEAALAFPARQNWWLVGAAPSVRAEGVDAFAGTLQTFSFELPFGVEHRWRRIGLRGMLGPEFGRRTAGLTALDGEAWDPFVGIGFHLSTIVYFDREAP